MGFCVLVSCMHQKDHSILEKSNIQSDCVVVNQCNHDHVDEFDFINKFGQKKHCKFISTTQRGLSRSRNLAIDNAPDDAICQICDDDETLEDNVEAIVLEAYEKYQDAALIAFAIYRKDLPEGKKYTTKNGRLNYIQSLKICSVQITISKPIVSLLKVRFDVNKGSGTNNGAGEENKFMLDIRRAKGKAYFFNEYIATVNPGTSMWFTGYDREYMIKDACETRKLLGPFLAFFYCNYWVIRHYSKYKNNMTFIKALFYYMKGYFTK